MAGARLAGMGGAAVPVSDDWAPQYNIGALGGLEAPQLAFAYQTRLSLPELSTAAVVLNWPFSFAKSGFSISRYGFGPHHSTEVSAGFARRLELVSLGIQGGFVQTATHGFGSRTFPLLSLGGTAQLLPSLCFGASVYNITQSGHKEETAEPLPTLLRAGLQWQAAKYLLLVIETEKDVDHRARYKTGLEYKLRPFLALRTGISTEPLSLHGGLGVQPERFSFDYALQHHPHLGLMHHLSFGLKLGKEK